MNQDELTYIKLAYPDADDLHFKITAPLCSLVIAPGIGNVWATGKYSDPKSVAPLSIKKSRNLTEVVAVGAFTYRTPPSLLPHMNLAFGRLKPFSLSIEAGNLRDHFDFGGLPLSSLDIQYGAGDQTIDFSYPNPQVMHRMKITADAGLIQIENMGNANAAEIRLNGDDTCYRMTFGEDLKQNTVLHIGIAVSKVEVFIPASTAVKIIAGNPPVGSRNDFLYEDKAYWNSPARDHQEPLLQIFAPHTSLNIQTI